MKPLVVAFGLAISSQQALANTGSINFFGQVHSGTCAVEIIDPSTGLPASRIYMGEVSTAQFKQPDDEAANRAFGLRLTPGGGCILLPGANASVTFTGSYGGAGASGTLYALEPGGATGLALIIKDNVGTPVDNGIASKRYPLHDSKPTDMLFSAAYKAIDTQVTAGSANSDVQFTVAIP
ncbi:MULTISPECIES: fimbrial protein [Pseudomonas]|jgi:major type 1 subunit fimbrin (pilin)|uniref:fimbrial protein n=1 Tax=Pseudomonas TaxID=286 RepID=UPI0005340F33|nr:MULTISPECIES: fimbrial protein [Pseudomonas]KLJ14289.1 type 1 pili subunit FimI [Pseudomonas sp. TJI-51]MBA6122960.1 type 1 fimbrial protein [Pseudomonas juntendi]MBI6915287.1 type 1 fimbrial protein [Pseudomonas juntendi]MCF3158523.1 type 1 fimbrial protein [Pseudomonas juntendi]MCQ1991611.1 type 1 fimbrial protein [Pseudomonas sp. Eb3]